LVGVSGTVYGDGEVIGTVSGDIALITYFYPIVSLIAIVSVVFLVMYMIKTLKGVMYEH